jgi:hypothetical protein
VAKVRLQPTTIEPQQVAMVVVAVVVVAVVLEVVLLLYRDLPHRLHCLCMV